jgi:hypothetical protein
MAAINAAQAAVKTVADPNASYESLKPLQARCKAVCSGERFVKDSDRLVSMSNFLIPFSPSMSQAQYDFFKAEAELPGITAQFAKMLVGGLLRKTPTLTLPEGAPEGAADWILNDFGQDDSTLVSFLDECLWEEIRTSRCWVYIDYPSIENIEDMDKDEQKDVKPFPTIWKSDFVINWHVSTTSTGKNILDRVITSGTVEKYEEENEFHPILIETVWVHELIEGKYQIRVYEKTSPTTDVPVVAGHKQSIVGASKAKFELIDTITSVEANGEPLSFIPAWPLNGSSELTEPLLTSIVDKEVSLYNKLSRRNHLLYSASTYTPVIISDMSNDDFKEIVDGGLGTWIRLRQGDDAKVLETPTEALQDMDRAIAASIEEMAKLGIRMLSPETQQSGIALQLRNASQTAQLGSLNSKVSSTLQNIIAFMINWRYDTDITAHEVDFSMSADFNPIPLGDDWLRLATEWYEGSLIPRSIWLQILKQNDILPADYDDEEGKVEINSDELLIAKVNERFADNMKDDE